MRTFLIAGNWKMNLGPADAADLINGIKEAKPEIGENVDVLVCPPFVSLSRVNDILDESDIMLGAQNIHTEDSGAYTGEISAPMLVEAGCTHVIIGHSERRQYFGETNTSVNQKTKKALEKELIPVVCVGELLEERKAGEHMNVVATQIKGALEGISGDEAMDIVVAYEPVWAIGTGEVASPEQAQEMHAFIRSELAALYDEETADQVRILYGGSMKPGNAEELLGQPDVDGGLIGGASMKASDFSEIITIAENQS